PRRRAGHGGRLLHLRQPRARAARGQAADGRLRDHLPDGQGDDGDREEMEALSSPRMEWGAATRTLPGESESGDRHLVMDRPGAGRLLERVGVVGVRLPALLASSVAVPGAGLLIFATDGIATGFDRDIDHRTGPQPLADQILARHSKGTDDALVLVARLGR